MYGMLNNTVDDCITSRQCVSGHLKGKQIMNQAHPLVYLQQIAARLRDPKALLEREDDVAHFYRLYPEVCDEQLLNSLRV